MAPRKKLNASSASSKKSNPKDQNSQPSKYGIQHFFERHTQSALSNSQNPQHAPNPRPLSGPITRAANSRALDRDNAGNAPVSNPEVAVSLPRPVGSSKSDSAIQNSTNAPNSETLSSTKGPNAGLLDLTNVVSVSRNPKNSSNLQKTGPTDPSQITPPENLLPITIDIEDNQPDVSPEISKSMPLKRFKFSPGMLIKQSQDDGGDEITWKISPVNERLQMVTKRIPETIRVLADASRLNSLSFRQCSQNKISPAPEGKLEKWLSSPTLKTTRKTLLANKVGLKRCPDQDTESNRNAIDTNNASVVSQQSPFRTPPSLTCCQDKLANDIECNEASNQLGFRKHKKALIELLDQVGDVISVEESTTGDMETRLSDIKDRNGDSIEVKPAVKRAAMISLEKVNRPSLNPSFLVLEVSEKRKHTESQCPFKVLRLLNEQSGEERAVFLRDEWFYSVIAPGDTIQVIGEFDDEGKCDVGHDNNLIIVHPDLLVSGTRVASSFSCPRRSVLDERLKCSEHSIAALIGTLLHQIFQAGLTRELPTKEFLEEYARIVLQKNVESLYACGVNEKDMYKTLTDAIPKILNWINLFKDSQDLNAFNVKFGSDDGLKKVTISEVIDIEEMAWAPKYGLKGMIDASLRVKVESNANKVIEKIVPLEFKTGKGTSGQSAMEHCAQVILYTLLMSERYLKHIDSGLLYYLHTDQTQGIEVRRSDLVGLIMRRNELASDILKASTTQQLPPMLQSPSMCKGCRHLSVCTIYHKAHGGSTESSGLGDVFDSHVNHLTKTHYIFLKHWNRLIDLEATESQVAKRNIWRSHSPKSDRSSSCLSSVVLDVSEKIPLEKSSDDNRFIYRFVRQDSLSHDSKTNGGDYSKKSSSSTYDLDCTLKSGDYVILSTKFGRLAVASGVVRDISRHHISVSFSKSLRLPGSYPSLEAQDLLQEVWQIDKDEFSSSFAVMRFNLVQLFLQSEQNSHIRKMIVDLEVPRFDGGCIFSQDPAISYIRSEKNLNNDQRRAILKILTAKDYALILGMPGTGKTSTMVHAVKALLMRGASILLTSYTNSAVDNLLIKLKAQSIDFVRIGRLEAVHEEVRDHCISAMDIFSVEDIKIKIDQVKVVGVTCLGVTSPLLANKRFDVCIMDEAGQTTLPVSLGPLMFASTFVLVGDHYQLPPLVQSAEARETGMGISLFCRLSEAQPQAISALQSQYRMCQGIMELSNALIYGNRLLCGSSEIANATLNLSNSKFISLWMEEVLDNNKAVIFINTDNIPAYEAKDHKAVNNPIEALIVSEVAKELLHNGIEAENIGIITPYNSQTNLIRQAVNSPVEIHTIDKYQGRDKDCIVVSFVRSSEKPKHSTSSLLGDWHRINVAITRSKKKLIMVGSCKTLSKVPLLKLLINKVDEQSGIVNVYKKDINFKEELKGCSQFRKEY